MENKFRFIYNIYDNFGSNESFQILIFGFVVIPIPVALVLCILSDPMRRDTSLTL